MLLVLLRRVMVESAERPRKEPLGSVLRKKKNLTVKEGSEGTGVQVKRIFFES